MTVQTATLTGRFLETEGRVVAVPSAEVQIPAENAIIPRVKTGVYLDDDGAFSMVLAKTNQGEPAGWTWDITWYLKGAKPVTRRIHLTADADLADLGEATEVPATYSYVLAASVGTPGGPGGPLDQAGQIPSGQIPPGAAGPQGDPGPQGEPGEDGADGAPGLSAYQIWLNLGNSGTQQDFIDSLTGPAGAPGQDGAPGEDGLDGAAGADGLDGQAIPIKVTPAYITSGDVALVSTSGGWAEVPGFVLDVDAETGDYVELHLGGLRSVTSGAYVDVALKTGPNTYAWFASSGGSTRAPEGLPDWYSVSGFQSRSVPPWVIAQAGHFNAGKLKFVLLYKSGGTGTLYASTSYPFRWVAKNYGPPAA